MNVVERLLGETLATGELDRQLRRQYCHWKGSWDFGEFRQAVLGHAWERREQFRGQTAAEFMAWLRRLSWTIGVNRWRERQRQAGLLKRLAFLLPQLKPSPTELVDTRDLIEWLLAGVTDRERKLLVLKYYKNLSSGRLAKALETTRAGVHQLHYRALAKLRARMKKLDQ